jgi:hypothetical protein
LLFERATTDHLRQQPQFIVKDFKKFHLGFQPGRRSGPRRTIRNRTGKSNEGTNGSKESASGQERRCRWTMPGVWSRATWSCINVRLNSAIGYITPTDMLTGRQAEIRAQRDRKLEEAA